MCVNAFAEVCCVGESEFLRVRTCFSVCMHVFLSVCARAEQ